ncbi:MAG TPA: carboxylesterase family protein [Stellaceae bacterium]|nr:carboxylesterase family protein [Stellaceae bacterium]
MILQQKSWTKTGRWVFGALAAGLLAASPIRSAAADSLTVSTDSGPVTGASTHTMREFLGIPYAAPPVGELRWQPPQAPVRWKKPRDATRFAPHCTQNASPFGVASASEDCLYLNVYTPKDGGGNRPVMVWIHGGALVVGEGDDYNPERMVEQGDVVVVTINYRLGLFGYMAHPALSAESPEHISGNYGLLDQQFALQWVRRNIDRFGGDHNNVTLFGESAGGLSTLSNVASPRAAGLFHRAIVESGAYALNLPSLATAEAQGGAIGTSLGCSTADCLRSLTVAQLLSKTGSGITPDVDGEILPQTLATAFSSGEFNRVPIIQGSNHDEFTLFVGLDFDLVSGPVTAAAYPFIVRAIVGTTLAPAALAEYPLSNYANPDDAVAALGTDITFACPARSANLSLSRHVRTFAYEFNDANAPQNFLPPISIPYGAAHASEIQYLFTLPQSVTLTPTQQRLSETMIAYWTQFARTGDPNTFRRHHFPEPFWPHFPGRDEDEDIQSLAPARVDVESDFATRHHCAFWDAHGI